MNTKQTSCTFSLNRMSAPQMPFGDFTALCQRLGIRDIEIRNDLSGIEINDGTPASDLRGICTTAGLTILSINALQRFEQFDDERESEAIALARYAQQCGAKALVLCPTNSRNDRRDSTQRHTALVDALKRLRPILEDHGLSGLIEPLGFEECALRRKSDAVKGIYDAAGEQTFRLVHDTFHHHLSREDIFYPNLTGLVHISGVEESDLAVDNMRDGHRVLVGDADRLGNLRQLRTLKSRGYEGPFSFEPFAQSIAKATDIEAQLKASMTFIEAGLV